MSRGINCKLKRFYSHQDIGINDVISSPVNKSNGSIGRIIHVLPLWWQGGCFFLRCRNLWWKGEESILCVKEMKRNEYGSYHSTKMAPHTSSAVELVILVQKAYNIHYCSAGSKIKLDMNRNEIVHHQTSISEGRFFILSRVDVYQPRRA